MVLTTDQQFRNHNIKGTGGVLRGTEGGGFWQRHWWQAATGVRIVIDGFTLSYPHPFPATGENPPTWLWLSYVTCFGPREVSKRDANRGFKSPCSVGSAALALRHRWENKPGRVSSGMKDKQSRVELPGGHPGSAASWPALDV